MRITGFVCAILCAISVTSTAADLTETQEWLEKAKIKELVDSYAITRDNKDARGYANTFAEDGALILYGTTYKGREAIFDRASGGNPNGVSMHMMSAGEIQIIDESTATGMHYAAVYIGTREEDADVANIPNFTVMGKYHDKYIKTDEGWKFAERRLEAVFRPAQ